MNVFYCILMTLSSCLKNVYIILETNALQFRLRCLIISFPSRPCVARAVPACLLLSVVRRCRFVSWLDDAVLICIVPYFDLLFGCYRTRAEPSDLPGPSCGTDRRAPGPTVRKLQSSLTLFTVRPSPTGTETPPPPFPLALAVAGGGK